MVEPGRPQMTINMAHARCMLYDQGNTRHAHAHAHAPGYTHTQTHTH
jgi:hypothetical protein